jgi:hypothetical protein
MDADFDPFAMKATMAGKISSKKRKVIDDLNATTEAEENEIIENDADGEKENNFEHRNAQQQRQQQQTLKEVEFNIDVVRDKRLKRAKREKRLALEREKKASADAELLKKLLYTTKITRRQPTRSSGSSINPSLPTFASSDSSISASSLSFATIPIYSSSINTPATRFTISSDYKKQQR